MHTIYFQPAQVFRSAKRWLCKGGTGARSAEGSLAKPLHSLSGARYAYPLLVDSFMHSLGGMLWLVLSG